MSFHLMEGKAVDLAHLSQRISISKSQEMWLTIRIASSSQTIKAASRRCIRRTMSTIKEQVSQNSWKLKMNELKLQSRHQQWARPHIWVAKLRLLIWIWLEEERFVGLKSARLTHLLIRSLKRSQGSLEYTRKIRIIRFRWSLTLHLFYHRLIWRAAWPKGAQ